MRVFMKRWKGLAVLAVFVVPFLVAGCTNDVAKTVGQGNPNPEKLNPVGTIQGKLRDKATLEPIAGAVVDIGVAKATTSETGQFKLENVPATRDASKGTVSGAYNATVDLREVNKKIDAENKKTEAENKKLPAGSTPKALKAKYPEFAYQDMTVEYTSLKESETLNVAESQHDTPVDHLVFNGDVLVGRLHANIEGLVAGCSGTPEFYTPVGAGYTVKLYTSSSSDTTGSGASDRLLGQTTTDASGKYAFSNVEAGLDVRIDAVSADGAVKGSEYVTMPVDGETLALTDIQQSVALHVCPLDVHGPEITHVSPEVGSDQAPGSMSVEITFSEPVDQTAATGTDPSGVDNLYDNIEVMFDGSKAGNVAYSLAWNSAFDKLTVTIPTTGASALYHVRLQDIDAVFADASGMPAALGVCPDDDTVPAQYGVIGDGAANDCTVYFTTNGGTTPAPVTSISLVNAAGIDNKGADAVLDWPSGFGSKTYNVYCRAVQVFSDGSTQTHPYVILGSGEVEVNGSSAVVVLDPGSLVENGNIQLKWECKVRGVNSDGVEGADADPAVTAMIKDAVGPQIEAGDELACGVGSGAVACDTNDEFITGINLVFDEELNDVSAQTASNYTVSVATGTALTVTTAVYDPAALAVALTLSSPLAPSSLNPSTIEAGLNGVIDTAAAGDDVLVVPGCVSAGSDDFLDTTESGDDEFVGNGISVGNNGVCESTAAGDDVQEIPVDQGVANAVCVAPGTNGVLNTKPSPNGDDAVSGLNIVAGPDGVCDPVMTSSTPITSGDNGYLDSTRSVDDVSNRATCVGPGADKILATTAAGDDELVVDAVNGNSVNVGADGVCNTTVAGGSDDTQNMVVGNGTVNVTCVTAGDNLILNTTPSGDDNIFGTIIRAGADGVCNTAATAYDVQAIPTAKSSNGTTITAGVNGVIDSTLAGDDERIGAVGGDDDQVIAVGDGLNATTIQAGDNLILDSTLTGDDEVVGGLAVTVSNVTDVAGNEVDSDADEYNTDGSVE